VHLVGDLATWKLSGSREDRRKQPWFDRPALVPHWCWSAFFCGLVVVVNGEQSNNGNERKYTKWPMAMPTIVLAQ
jgi:hypothetical protein